MKGRQNITQQIEAIEVLERETEQLQAKNKERSEKLRFEARQRSIRASLDAAKAAKEAARVRTQTLLRLGILIEGSGLADLNRDVLEGALISAKEREDDIRTMRKFRIEGAATLAAVGPSSARMGPADKTRNHLWIKAGAVFERTGVLDWDVAILASVLHFIAGARNDVAHRKRWFGKAFKGGAIDDTAPMYLAFSDAIEPDLSIELRALGLEFDRANKLWSGAANPWDICILTDRGRYRLKAKEATEPSSSWIDICSLLPAIERRKAASRPSSGKNGRWILHRRS